MKNILVSTFLVALTISGATHAGDVAAGKTKSAACAGCHGADGNSINPIWPSLAGQHENYLVKQLKDFQSGARKEATMTAMAAPLSEQDVNDVAAYFAAQSVKVGEAAADKVEMGQKLYRAGNPESGVSACSACHGPSGAGNPQANFPSLTGQKAGYVAKSLSGFASGERDNDEASMMRDIASKMTNAEIEAVSQYVQGLH